MRRIHEIDVRSRRFAVCVRILVLAILGVAAGSSTVGAQVESVRDFVHQQFMHGVPYDVASEFDRQTAVPELLGMLESSDEARARANVATTLGMIGDPRAVQPLIALVHRGSDRLSRAEYNARTAAVTALGLIVNKEDDPEAFTYLKDGVNPEAWDDRPIEWLSPYDAGPRERNMQLAQMAMIALGYTGRKDGTVVLAALKARSGEVSQYVSDGPPQVRDAVLTQFFATLEEAVKTNQEIAAGGPQGLATYFARVQEAREPR